MLYFEFVILYSPGKQLTRASTEADSKPKNHVGVDKLKRRTDSSARTEDLFPFLQIISAKG